MSSEMFPVRCMFVQKAVTLSITLHEPSLIPWTCYEFILWRLFCPHSFLFLRNRSPGKSNSLIEDWLLVEMQQFESCMPFYYHVKYQHADSACIVGRGFCWCFLVHEPTSEVWSMGMGCSFSGQAIKRRKRHRRKHHHNQEPCVMRGVYFKNMKWQAAIKVDKKQIHLGTVGSQVEAARLYDRYEWILLSKVLISTHWPCCIMCFHDIPLFILFGIVYLSLKNYE